MLFRSHLQELLHSSGTISSTRSTVASSGVPAFSYSPGESTQSHARVFFRLKVRHPSIPAPDASLKSAVQATSTPRRVRPDVPQAPATHPSRRRGDDRCSARILEDGRGDRQHGHHCYPGCSGRLFGRRLRRLTASTCGCDVC